MLTGRQIRKARSLLRWEQDELAEHAALTRSIVDRAEADDGVPDITLAQKIVIRHTLAKAGVEFSASDVRLRRADV